MLSCKLQMPTFGEIFRHLFLSWLLAALVEYLLVPADAKSLSDMSAVAAMSFPRLLLITVLGAGGLWLASNFFSFAKYERYAIPAVFLILTVVTLANSHHTAFILICLTVLAVLAVYSIWGYKTFDPTPKPCQKSHWAFPAALAVIAAGIFLLLSLWSVCRYLSFATPNFDFGIFSQMFHSMRTTGLPMTTVEREGLLSHFAVHVSPIYYLMLPFYCLFPDPAVLQVLQVIVICSSVIPLWLIGKQHGLSGLQRLLVCILLLMLPAVGGGVSYDLHENCFLLPLVLWLLYAMDKRNTFLTCLFAFLTLTVKEDAAVYVAVAALYLILRTALNYRRENRRDLITGAAILLGAVVYFLLVTNYLASHGDGVMTYRYRNFMLKSSDSLFSVILAVLLCPMKMLFECVDPEKQTYILKTLLPLLGLPLITRKYERFLLLIPYILLNLMSDYKYQHDIFFQYNFGSTAFLLYLTAVNLSDLKISRVRLVALFTATAAAGALFCSTVLPPARRTVASAWRNRGYYNTVRTNLDMIPRGASVSAGTFYVAYLSERSVLYDVQYASMELILTTEYVVVNQSSGYEFTKHGGYQAFSAVLESHGYEIINDHPSIVIYRKLSN